MIDLFSTGAYARAAGGNLERPDIQKPVVNWMAWSINPDNGGNGDPSVWARCRAGWSANGIQSFPWLHCHSMQDIERLITVAENNSSPAIGLNIEDVVGDKLSLKEVSGLVLDFWVNKYEKLVHMATEPWVQNSQGWGYMSFAVAALEIFPDQPTPVFPNGYNAQTCKDCITHAFNEGLTKVTLMLSTKTAPSVYGEQFSICHSLYTADDITPTAPAWDAWKSAPCVPLKGENVLTPTQKKNFRAEIVEFCKLAEQYESRWHYTQARPYTGLGIAPQTFHQDDCSSYCALVFYWAAHHTGVKASDPLDYHFSGYGNTQSAIDYLDAHKAPLDKYRIGDMAIYGSRSNTKHMTVCRKAGTGAASVWSSFGSEGGPDARSLHYRTDLVGVYRHPALL